MLEPLAAGVAARGRAATELVAGQWIWFDEWFRIGGWVSAGARQPAEPVRRPDKAAAEAIDRFDMLHRSASGFTGPVRVRGLARVAGVLDSTGRRSVVAVPLCAEAEAR